MSDRKFSLNVFYHVYNRGTEKRNVFLNDSDREKFLYYVFSSNSDSQVRQFNRHGTRTGNPIIRIHGFCLMNNHYHFLIEEIIEGGISKFMHRLATAYTVFFNRKHERTGALFQGKYKVREIENQAHLNYVLHYIHRNPVAHQELSRPEALNRLMKYPWSSFLDYVGIKNLPALTERDFFLRYYGGSNGYRTNFLHFLSIGHEDFEDDSLKDIFIDA